MNYNTLFVKYKNSWQLRTYQFCIKSDIDNVLDRDDVFNSEKDTFENVEHEIDLAFSSFDDKYHFDNHSSYVSVNRSKNKIYYYARSNDWTNGYFCTLTIDPKKYDSKDYTVVSPLIKNFTNYLRNYDSNIYGLFVPELHKSGAFHFHGLLSSQVSDLLQFSGHFDKSNRIYNCKSWRYGFSNFTPVRDSLAVEKYITKYTTKDLLNDTFYQHRYFTLNLSQADMIKLNIYDQEELYKELVKENCVLFCNTDGLYNRVTYSELKNSKKVLQIIQKYVNMSLELINKQTD